MSFIQSILFYVPSLLLGLIMVGGAVLLTIVGLLIVRRFVPHHRLKVHNDVSGPIFGTLGVVYAVLLAFVVIIVWEGFDKANLTAEKEANCVVDLCRDAQAFEPAFRDKVHGLFKEYATIVINEEWAMLAKGEFSPKAREAVKKIWTLYAFYQPRNPTEQAFFEESVRKLNDFGEFRLQRLIESRSGVHPVLWFVLLFGGMVTISFTFFFGAESLNTQMVMAVLLAIIISLILFTILMLDYPFTGDVRISPPDVYKIFITTRI